MRALLTATGRAWRGTAAQTLRGELAANLASGGKRFGIVNLLSAPLPQASADEPTVAANPCGPPGLRLITGDATG